MPLTVLILLVLGSILGGLATPAEAAMGALGGLVLAALYRELTWRKVKVFFYCKSNSYGMLVVRGIRTFASIFSYLGVTML